jgi:hypothetical protein
VLFSQYGKQYGCTAARQATSVFGLIGPMLRVSAILNRWVPITTAGNGGYVGVVLRDLFSAFHASGGKGTVFERLSFSEVGVVSGLPFWLKNNLLRGR